jgi:peptide deformylase
MAYPSVLQDHTMSLLAVARLGHPILRQIAAPVSPKQLASSRFRQFCNDLLESMYEQDGVGLAAPQVHESIRVVVFELSEEQGPIFLINPVITPISEARAWSYEGCLSVPEMRGRVERWVDIRVEALDRHGEPFVFEAHGYPARVVQHECDHLDGVLYIDRADPKSLAFLKEYRAHGPLVTGQGDDEDEGDED